MRSLIFVSLLCLLATACHRNLYQAKQEVTLSQLLSAEDLRPVFGKALYRCEVDGRFAIKKFHLSGVLYLKTMDDKSTRVIFQSEMGATLFDFGWDREDSFQVFSVIEQMNKAALIKTLRKDFELLLVKHIGPQPEGTYNFNKDPDLFYTKFRLNKGFVYYVTDRERRLARIENADDKQQVVVMSSDEKTPLKALPETLVIRHLKAGFSIRLQKITPDHAEE